MINYKLKNLKNQFKKKYNKIINKILKNKFKYHKKKIFNKIWN